ncbi:MAG: hypothetical protein Q9160_004915 [Pyrenula sp. 1 TL-2023]
MADPSLTSRLNALQQQYKQVLTLIQRLQKLPAIPGAYASTSERSGDSRVEVASEIHHSLKEQESELEVLRQEVEDEFGQQSSTVGGRWVGGGSIVRRRNDSADMERERILAQTSRLGEDLKAARSAFRRAQMEAKRNADQARMKEREMLFAGARSSAGENGNGELRPAQRRRGKEKLTEEEIALNASNDVTAAMRRTHDLMQASLEQSTFAQRALDESSAALKGLDESYGSLDTMLRTSRGLVSKLIKNQQDDRWCLEWARRILIFTIAYLVLRRIFWYPFLLLLWQLKWAWWVLSSIVMGAVGLTSKSNASPAVSATISGTSTTLRVPPQATGGIPERQEVQKEAPFMRVGGGGRGGGWGHVNTPPQHNEQRPTASSSSSSENGEKSMVNEIGEMAEKAAEAVQPVKEETNIDDVSEEEMARKEEIPRNPKKRMWEHEREEGKKDEL